jgi:hypothetical protein
MKNHIKAIGLQYSFYAIWVLIGLICSLMMPFLGKPLTLGETILFLILSLLILFPIITINYFISIKSLEFIEPLEISNYKKYIYAFLAYTGFYSVTNIFLLPDEYTQQDLIFFTKRIQIYAWLLMIMFFTTSIISYRIFNNKTE